MIGAFEVGGATRLQPIAQQTNAGQRRLRFGSVRAISVTIRRSGPPEFSVGNIQGTRASLRGDSVPTPLGFIPLSPEWLVFWGDVCRPAIPAAGSALWSHPCGAISSAQVLSE